MLADMYLPGMRSGGSWYNWIFKTVDLEEIENLTEERRANIIRS
jgi:dimethylaniline monooxygenase (N-oxide forming)